MMMGRSRSSAAAGRTMVLILALAAMLMVSAAEEEERGLWARVKALFTDEEQELPPVEEVFDEAEALFTGKETWYGRLVRRTWGEDSKAYNKLPGVKRKNFPRALEMYQKVMDNYPFSKYAPLAELRIGDCHYKLEEYEEAAIWYGQFIKMHPRREEVPYALFQQGMCHYNLMRKPPRDQDETLEALVIFEVLVEAHPGDEHAEEAREKIKECNERLAKHEMLVADFYYKKKQYWAAAARYHGVWLKYPGAGFDGQAMYFEGSCYEKLGKDGLAIKSYERTVQEFAGTEYGAKAQDRLNEMRQQGISGDDEDESDAGL